MKELKGIIPIIAAPFYEDGELDYDSLRSELGFMKKAGCNGATLFGIAGEYYKLGDAECEKMIDVTAEECTALELPFIISCTPHSTKCAVERAKYIEASGADCMMLLPPFFMKPSGKALFDHIRAVASAVSIPVMLQYAPEQTGTAIKPEELRRLSEEVPNLRYFKIECKPAGPYITTFLQEGNSENYRVFAGNAGYQMLETFDRGAVGAMPGNSMCELYVKIYKAYISGSRELATDLHDKLLPMLNHIRQNVDEIIHYEKIILFRRGIISTSCCRTPEFVPDEKMDELFEMYYSRIEHLLG